MLNLMILKCLCKERKKTILICNCIDIEKIRKGTPLESNYVDYKV